MRTLINAFGEQVKVGDVVALTTTSGKYSRTRVVKVVRIETIDYKRWDRFKQVEVPDVKYRTFVKLYDTKQEYDRTTGQWSSPFLKSYVKEVFGISDSVPIDINTLPREIMEILK